VNPEGITTGQCSITLHWLLTGVEHCIDLNRMSTTDRRDFPYGVSGSHMAVDRATCFLELHINPAAPPPKTYLLTLVGDSLRYADYRSVPSASFSGQMYAPEHGYSQSIFQTNSGEYAHIGLDGLLRYSAPALAINNSKQEVVGLFPSARPKLTLKSIEHLGLFSPAISVLLFGATEPISSANYAI
jgi:hypothetical protein